MKPIVKESEKSRVLKTKEYSLFEFPDFKISKKYLDRIKSSIIVKNLLPDYPILVNEKYEIVDGKYRFLAAYDLQIPIYYKVAEVTTRKDSLRIKSIHKNESIDNVMKIYGEIPEYKAIAQLKAELNDFFDFNELILSISELTKQGHFYTEDVTHIHLNRTKIESGIIESWDYKKARARLLRAKGFIDDYASYGWDNKNAIYITYVQHRKFDKNELTAIKFSYQYRDAIAGNKYGIDFRSCRPLDAYAAILESLDAIDQGYGIERHRYNILKSIGINVSKAKLKEPSTGFILK